MRPLAIALRLAPLAAAAFFSVATSMPAPTQPITCDPTEAAFTPAGLELGPPATSDAPDTFQAWQDADTIAIETLGEASDAMIVYRLRVVGANLPSCVRQVVVVTDGNGGELGRLDAALVTEPDGNAAQLTYDTPISLNRWPASGEQLIIEATVGETTTTVALQAR